MKSILFFIRRLHEFAGRRLILNMLGMTLVSIFEGISIYLIIPLLGMIGILAVQTGGVPLLGHVTGLFDRLPESWKLPVVLAVYAALITGQALMSRNQSIENVKIQQSFVRYLRTETYRSLLQANWLFFLRKRKSDFNHVLTSELARVSQGTQLTLKLTTSLVFTLIQIVFAFYISVQLTALVLVSGLMLALVSRRYVRHAKVLGSRTSDLSQHYFADVTEHFNGIKDIKSNKLEQAHYSRFKELCARMENNIVQFTRLQSTTQFFYRTASAVLIVLFVYLSFKVLDVQPSQLILVVIIFSRLWPRFTDIQSSSEQIMSNLPAFKSLIGLQRECEAAKEWDFGDAGAGQSLQIRDGIECREVEFRYDRSQMNYALRRISLRIPAGSMTAIVGKSGAGKSTLIDILTGMVEPESGELLVDGAPVGANRLTALRGSVGYVSQDPFLFHTSIRDNLLLVAPEAGDERLWEALRTAAADEFVRALPQGLDTVIGDRGVRLSGGERQRIVLARALLRRPSILVLDEATSALDNENEAKVQAALDRLKGSMTIIVIAHRLSTIRNADQVIVLEEGTIIQTGEYQQLSGETKGTFSQLLAYQSGAGR